MEKIYWTIVVLSILFINYIFIGYRLRKNRPNTKLELEMFRIPEKKEALLKEIVEDTKKNLEIDIVKEVVTILKQELDNTSKETTQQVLNNSEESFEPAWFSLQKRKALRQLKHYNLNNIEFIPDWTFEENEIVNETRGYLLDASNDLESLVKKILNKKERVVFYLSPESDGIYHKRIVSGARKTESTITVQVWHSKD